jgi:hypothetical protein
VAYFLRKNIWVFSNNPNLIQKCPFHLIEHTELVGGNYCYELHSGPIFSGQLDSTLAAQNYSIILSESIYVKNYMYALGVYDDEG